MLKSLVYISSVTSFTPIDLPDITSNSAAQNMAAGVTGLLAYNGQNFMQLLEGESDAVDATMARIAQDKRHENIVIIRTEDRETRECPYWGMVAMTMPLAGAGDATRIHGSLPAGFEADTRVLFTSFASMARA
jgi:hypothetical protein